MKRSNKTYMPNAVTKFTTIEKIGIIDSMLWMTFVFLAVCEKVTRVVPLVSKIILILTTLDFFFSLLLLIFWVLKYKKTKELKGFRALLDRDKFNNFCFEYGLYTRSLSSSREINIPEINVTDEGFRLAALPGIATKTLDARDSFNDFLAQNGSNVYIVNAYSGGDGWIYFVTQHEFRKDGIEHRKKSK